MRDWINKKIYEKFHIHRGSLPLTPWIENADRKMLAELFHDLGYKVGAEIGVRMGEYTQTLFDSNPGVEIYAIDTWSPYGRVSQGRQDKYYRICEERLKQYKVILVKTPSQSALNRFTDDFFDFVYIDGLHDFNSVIIDLIGWEKKVKRGGIISGHDYYFKTGTGVIPAVNAYTQAHDIQTWYITRDIPASYFWVKG